MSKRVTVTVIVGIVVAIVLLFVAEVASEDDAAAFVEHMHSHLDEVSAVKSAVIAGDLGATRTPARWLADHEEPPGMPEAWSGYVEEMQRHARVMADAEDVETAAVALGEIARACGDCHRATGFDVAFGFDQRPPDDVQNVMTQMQRHLWAADRMWEGLIGPSDNAWRWGTEILAEVQLTAADVGGDQEEASSLDSLAQRIRGIGRQGEQAASSPARAGLYGEFLSQCAACHQLTGGGPG